MEEVYLGSTYSGLYGLDWIGLDYGDGAEN
jgi:hypothetical protein